MGNEVKFNKMYTSLAMMEPVMDLRVSSNKWERHSKLL
jgi:hypothetical protein